MTRYLLAAAVALWPGLAVAQDAGGLWRTERAADDAYLEVRVGPCATDAARTCGVIERAVGVPAEARWIEGRQIITDMAPAGPARWSGGRIWAPDDDRTYRANMALTDAGLEVEGCVAVFCRGQTWTRLE